MDVQAPQVALSTVIGQLTLSNNEEFGVDYFAKYKQAIRRHPPATTNVFSGQDNPAIPVPNPSVSPGANILDPSNLINFSQIIQKRRQRNQYLRGSGQRFCSHSAST